MNEVFRPFLRKFVLVFFDDILVYSKTSIEHLQQLRMVLDVLCWHHLHAKKSKCTFGNTEVQYLGHVISKDGVAVDQQKI